VCGCCSSVASVSARAFCYEYVLLLQQLSNISYKLLFCYCVYSPCWQMRWVIYLLGGSRPNFGAVPCLVFVFTVHTIVEIMHKDFCWYRIPGKCCFSFSINEYDGIGLLRKLTSYALVLVQLYNSLASVTIRFLLTKYDSIETFTEIYTFVYNSGAAFPYTSHATFVT